jgi:hypothetical protein
MQLLRGHVKRITEMLDRRESDRLKMLIGEQGECLPGIEDGEVETLDGLSKKLQELSDKPINIRPLLKQSAEDKIGKSDLCVELDSGNITPEDTFLLPMIKIKARSRTSLLDSEDVIEDVSPLRRRSSTLKSGTQSPALSRQSSRHGSVSMR